MSDTEQPAAHRSPSAGLVIALGSVAVFFVALELTIISVALPDIAIAFPDASRATLSWIFTAYNVGVAALLLIGGWMAERFGRKRLFLVGLLVFTLGSAGSGLAPTVGILIAARTVQAIGGALLIPASLALILHVVAAERRDAAIGIWGAMAGLAAAIGPTLGAVLVDTIGWRSVFLVNIPIAVVTFVIGARALPESKDRNIGAVDLVSVQVGAAGVGLLVFIVVAAGSVGWTSPLTIGCGLTGLALLAGFVVRTMHHPHPVFDPEIAQQRTFSAGSLGTLFFVAGFTGWLVFAPTFLTEVWDYSILRAGLAIAPGPLVMAVVSGPAGKVAAARGHRLVIVTGALLSLSAITWWLVVLGSASSYVGGLLPGLVLMGAGVGAGFPMLTAASMLDVEPHQYAIGAAGSTTVRQVAMAVGIAIATAFIGSTDGSAALDSYRNSWIACGVMFAIAGAVMVALLPAPHPPTTTSTDSTSKAIHHV